MNILCIALPATLLLTAAFTPAPVRSVTVLFDLQGHTPDCRCDAVVYPLISPPWVVNGVIEVAASVEQITSKRGYHMIPNTTCTDQNCEGSGIAVIRVSSQANQSYWMFTVQYPPGSTIAFPLNTSAACGLPDAAMVTVQSTATTGGPGDAVVMAGIKLDCGL